MRIGLCIAVVLCVLVVSACGDSPSPQFGAQPGQDVTVGGHLWRVHVDGDRAQAIRVSRAKRPHVAQMVPYGMAAIVQATGCRIVGDRTKGDTNVVNAHIRC